MRNFWPLLSILAASIVAPRTLLAESPEVAASQSDAQATILFRSVNTFWSREVRALGGKHYQPPTLKFFRAPIDHGCGSQAALTGPFYCPADGTVYLDRDYLRQLRQRDKANAKLLLGLVVAHEIAHHVQNVLGTTSSVEQALASSNAELSQRTFTTFELQADCYAGLWVRAAAAHGTVRVPADVAAPLETIAAMSREWQSHLPAGRQLPDPLSEGNASQRLKWFHLGLDSGDFNTCDTFSEQAAGRL